MLIQNPNYNPNDTNSQRFIFDNPNQVINQTTGQTAATLTSTDFAPVEPIQIAPQPTPNINAMNAISAGAVAGATYTTPSGAKVDAQGNLITPPPETPTPTTPTEPTIDDSRWTKLMKWVGISDDTPITPMPKPLTIEERMAEQQAVEDKYQLQQKTETLNKLNAQLADLTAQQQSLQMQQQYIPEAMQQQAAGRGITAAGLAPLTAGELRKNALAMLPITQQILGVSAQMAAAKGDYDTATANIDKMLGLQQQTREEQYNYWNKQFEFAMAVADREDQERLLKAKDKKDKEEAEAKRIDALRTNAIGMAKDSGQFDIASKLALAKTENEIVNLTGQIKKKEEKVSTPSSYQEWSLAGGEKGTGMSYGNWLTKKETGVSITSDDKRNLIGSGLSETDILNIQKDISQYGIDKVLENITDKTQRDAIAKVYGKQQKVTREQIEKSVTQKTAADSLKNKYTEEELKEMSDKYGFSSFWTSAKSDIERFLNSDKAKEVYIDLLYQQYKDAGMVE